MEPIFNEIKNFSNSGNVVTALRSILRISTSERTTPEVVEYLKSDDRTLYVHVDGVRVFIYEEKPPCLKGSFDTKARVVTANGIESLCVPCAVRCPHPLCTLSCIRLGVQKRAQLLQGGVW